MTRLQPFELCAGSESAADVGQRLAVGFAFWLVVRWDLFGRTSWRTFEVTPDLLRRLQDHRGSVQVALDLPSKAVLRDRSASPRTLASQVSAVPGVASRDVYLALAASAEDLQEDEAVEFELTLDRVPPVGNALLATVEFGSAEQELIVHTSVSTEDFCRPKGAGWSHQFVLDRDLSALPHRWTFRARALGQRPRYSISVRLVARGRVIGTAVATLAGRQAGQPPLPVATHSRVLPLPGEASAVPVMVEIAHQGGGVHAVAMYRDGVLQAETPWIVDLPRMFDDLEAAASLSAVEAIGVELSVELPPALRAFLDDSNDTGKPTVIASSTPVAPFEVLRLRPASNGPLLGVERPVLRWATLTAATQMALPLHEVACIRPNYPSPHDLPSAQTEEDLLTRRYGARPLRTIAELRNLLQSPSVRVVHFAGHADGNPAKLMLEDGAADPRIFMPGLPLMAQAHPLFFVNGCRAGIGRLGATAAQANLARWLLSCGATGVVAPMGGVQSAAASEAARIFYDAVEQRCTVGEATQLVRAQAEAAPAGHAASYLSYLAYASPELTLGRAGDAAGADR
jgi:hypothetical protein